MSGSQWKQEIRYQQIMSDPSVRERIARHAAMAKTKMSAEEFLGLCDGVIPLGAPVETIAMLAHPFFAASGIRTGKRRNERFPEPPGEMLVRVLCSLARNGQNVRNVIQGVDDVLIDAVLPSDMWAFPGDLAASVTRETGGTMVHAATAIKGQLFDWGKSRRALDRLFADLSGG